MYLETDRTVIRPFAPDDGPGLHEILGDPEVMARCEPPYTPAQSEAFLADFCIRRERALAAVRKSDGKLIGYVLFQPLEPEVYEIGWFFRRDIWRQGYACEVCSAVIGHAFAQLNAHKLVAETIDAVKSVPLMEKLGMVREGVQRSHTHDPAGGWADFYLYGMLREDWER